MSARISIVTPSYNQAKFLEETLRSVLSQRAHVHEYLVLDGGSTDGSVETIRKYQHLIDYWTSERDGGQSDAIDRGFQRATGDYILWLNSDDVLLPGALAAVQEALARHPDWDVVTGNHVRIGADSRIVSAHRVPKESARSARFGTTHVCQPACYIRRSLYERVGPVDKALHCVMDTDLWFRLFDAGARCGHVHRYLAAFRKHDDAKGVSPSWLKRYRDEQQQLAMRFPAYAGKSLTHRIGRAAYLAGQLLSGRQVLAWADSLRWRGARLDDAFPFEEIAPSQAAGVGASARVQ
jgi:glycosyltransferase involved in cell wall biosynthesis